MRVALRQQTRWDCIDLRSSAKTYDRDEQRDTENCEGYFQACRPSQGSDGAGGDQRRAIPAIPAPCGVGVRCDDRAFGFASATRNATAGSPT